MPDPKVRSKGSKDEEEKKVENPNSVLNILKRGFMPSAERVDAQKSADYKEEKLRREGKLK